MFKFITERGGCVKGGGEEGNFSSNESDAGGGNICRRSQEELGYFANVRVCLRMSCGKVCA